MNVFKTTSVRRASAKRYYERCKKKILAFAKIYYKRHREKILQQRLADVVGVRRRAKESRTRRVSYLHDLRVSTPCKDCGKQFPHYVMEFDHTRGKKMATIGCGSTLGWARLLAEINKCDLVCANCHRTRGWKRRKR